MKVYKFGGASVKNADGVRNLKHIIDGQSERYKYLATTYLLVNQKCTSNVSVKIWDNSGFELHTLNYRFVPFQRNYRTNIIGHLLTNPNLFTIVIEKKFDGDSE